jgi:hypothetical protein
MRYSMSLKKVRRAVLRNTVDGELGKTQAECYGLLADLQMKLRGCISKYNTIAVVPWVSTNRPQNFMSTLTITTIC